MLTNKILNWDDLNCLFSKGETFILGRWFLSITEYIFPNISLPTFNGIIAIILLSISGVFIVDILEIKNKTNRILVGAILVSFPVFTATLTYMFTVHSYMLALFMSILSAYLAKKENSALSYVLSICLLTFSLGTYQTYISITATLLIILLIKKCFEEKDYKRLLFQTIKYLSILVISLLLYAIINQIIITKLGIQLSEYQGIASMGTYSIKGILKGIAKSYIHIILPFNLTNGIGTNVLLIVIRIICFTLVIFYLFVKMFKNIKQKFNLGLGIFCLLLLPITFNMVYIFSPSVCYHFLMMFGDCFIYISLILIIDKDKKYFSGAIKLLLLIQIFTYVYIANASYLKMHLSYENTYAFYTGLITNIQNTEGYDENTKIAIIGDYASKELYQTNKFNIIDDLTGVTSNIQLINSYSKFNFIIYYIGFNGNFIQPEKATEILKDNEEYINMPVYPYKGSIKKIDNLLVVKLSE